jgi:hypothetical protein
MTEDPVHRPLAIEPIEDKANDLLDLLVRVQGDLSDWRLHVPDRDSDHQLPATSLVQFPLVHSLLENMQFCFIHHAGQAQQQAIRVFSRVVDRFRVGEQDAESGAEFQEMMPVLAGPGQSAHLQPEDQPHPIQCDLGE